MGSADWMHRNLSNRVEVVTPIHDAELKRYLKDVVLNAYLRDNVKTRRLLPNGKYERLEVPAGEEGFDVQKYFIDAIAEAGSGNGNLALTGNFSSARGLH